MNLRTYADGYGRWHVVISAYGGLADSAELRDIASRLIRYELSQRDSVSVRIRAEHHSTTSDDKPVPTISIDYVEVNPL